MTLENTNNKPVSLRLPPRVAEMLDQEVERRNTNASEVIRRAIVLMNRMRDGVFVPISNEERDLLELISEKRELPAEEILSNWVSSAIKVAISEKPVFKLRLKTISSQTLDFRAENEPLWLEKGQAARHAW